MDDIYRGSRMKKVMGERRDLIRDVMMNGMLKDVEHYKSLQGELTVINLVEETIREFYKEI